MPTRLSVACLLLGIPLAARGGDDDVKKAAKAKAEETQAALVKGEFDKLAGLTHPKVVELMGGKEKMVAHMTAETKKMKAEGFEFKSVKMYDPGDPIRVGKETYIGVPFDLEMTVPKGRLLTRSVLIGISADDGKTWSFVDANPGREQLKKILPNLPDGIVFPKKEPPTFIKD